MNKKRVSIAIPASVISDTPHLREKTSKVGLIGRAAAIFRVEEIIVYPDNPKVDQRRDLEFIALLLSYLETPQYLRKSMFSLQPSLEYAGILPPLRTPNHPSSGKTKHLQVGEYREGLVLSETKEGLLLDIGVQQSALLRQKGFPINSRLSVQVVKAGQTIEIQTVNREDIPVYWGYQVKVEKRLIGEFFRSGDFDLIIATARVGEAFMNVSDRIGASWVQAEKVLVAFGAPTRGLPEIVQEEGLRLEEIADFTVNTIPSQGTVTVRTEEAILASLAIFNLNFNY
jgi:methyltransferase